MQLQQSAQTQMSMPSLLRFFLLIDISCQFLSLDQDIFTGRIAVFQGMLSTRCENMRIALIHPPILGPTPSLPSDPSQMGSTRPNQSNNDSAWDWPLNAPQMTHYSQLHQIKCRKRAATQYHFRLIDGPGLLILHMYMGLALYQLNLKQPLPSTWDMRLYERSHLSIPFILLVCMEPTRDSLNLTHQHISWAC